MPEIFDHNYIVNPTVTRMHSNSKGMLVWSEIFGHQTKYIQEVNNVRRQFSWILEKDITPTIYMIL
jgi:hypothetical protein